MPARQPNEVATGFGTVGFGEIGAKTILSALPVAVVALDAADRFLFANHAAEQFFVISAIQLIGLKITDFVPTESILFQMIRQVRSNGVTISAHGLALESPRLAQRCANVQLAPLPAVAGGVVLGLEDTVAARSFDERSPAPSERRGVAGMAAVMAHEVKNPLSGIRGAAQLLEASSAPQDRELAVLIRDEADRIRALIERMDLLGREPVECGPVNIHRVLEHVRRLAKNGFARNIRLIEHYDPSLPLALGDRDQLVQVILNLVKNAAEAITASDVAGGEIVLSTAFRKGVWHVAGQSQERRHLPLLIGVRDNGSGIPARLRSQLFEPFVSGKEGGSGLGLALVAKIVGEHGGLIDVESRPGRTEFRLHLPMAGEGESE